MTETDLLLIEDNEHDAELAVRALRKNNPDGVITIARDGAEALEIVGRSLTCGGSPKVIFLDLKLPVVDGLEVLKRLKGGRWTSTIPVVVLTSSAEERDVEKAYRYGANSYIVKPLEYDEYMRAVDEVGSYWLARNRILS